jgi:bacterioferritin-associated ferredoxin
MAQNQKNDNKRLICLCNEVSQETIEAAIARGCSSMGKIFDATLAGCGACGGSCQPTIRRMLSQFAENGSFPENPRHPSPSERQEALDKRKAGGGGTG